MSLNVEMVVALTDRAIIEDPSVIHLAVKKLRTAAHIPDDVEGGVSLRGISDGEVFGLERVVLHVVLHVKP